MVGEICHIEAAEKKGARFNPQMTNEARRSIGNLILLCRNHHVIVDRDQKEYTVSKLKKIKKAHEKPYLEVEDTLKRNFETGITDYTDNTHPSLPTSLSKFQAVMNSPLEPVMVEDAKADILEFSKRLSNLPLKDRDFIKAVVERAHKIRANEKEVISKISLNVQDAERAFGMGSTKMKEHCQSLERHQLGGLFERDHNVYDIEISDPSEYVTWHEILLFSQAQEINFEEFVMRAQFQLLD